MRQAEVAGVEQQKAVSQAVLGPEPAAGLVVGLDRTAVGPVREHFHPPGAALLQGPRHRHIERHADVGAAQQQAREGRQRPGQRRAPTERAERHRHVRVEVFDLVDPAPAAQPAQQPETPRHRRRGEADHHVRPSPEGQRRCRGDEIAHGVEQAAGRRSAPEGRRPHPAHRDPVAGRPTGRERPLAGRVAGAAAEHLDGEAGARRGLR